MVAAILVAATAVQVPGSPAAAPATEAAPTAAFTGEHLDGLPVYRLPPVHVVASRRAGLARTADEGPGRASAPRP